MNKKENSGCFKKGDKPKKKVGERGPNRNTAQVRECLKLLFEENLAQLKKDISELDPKDRVAALLRMAELVLPRLAAVSLDMNAEIRQSHTFDFGKMPIGELSEMAEKLQRLRIEETPKTIAV